MVLSSMLKGDPVGVADRARDSGDWLTAVKSYAAALKNTPGNAAIWVQYGHALKETGQFEEAEAAYRSAIQHDPENSDTHLQIGHLLKVQGRLQQAMAAYKHAEVLDPRNADAIRERIALDELITVSSDPSTTKRDRIHAIKATPKTVFDCSDLIQYFKDNRLPTGIQRVQINIVSQYTKIDKPLSDIVIVFFDSEKRCWRIVSSLDFIRMVNSAQNISEISDAAWNSIYSQIISASNKEYPFFKNDVLVNLGTSWWISDYFLIIRTLKYEKGIRYLPFLHDCIPLVTPEYCSQGLVKEFRNWLRSLFSHADGYLVNSQATSSDVIRFAERFGYQIAQPTVVRLDGDIRGISTSSDGEEVESDLAEFLQRERMPEKSLFVLMVSTLEARKNHIFALRLWDRMMSDLGENATPYLLCVGKSGWRFEETRDFLSTRPKLKRRVRFVSNLGDDMLGSLYRNCLFTLYPSHYEGWGLPVTESLCYGKVAVVSSNSSLTEAGGEFADYFQPGSLSEAYNVAVRLIADIPYRASREQVIATRFKPRSWADMARDVSDAVAAVRETKPQQVRSGFQTPRPGILYFFNVPDLIETRGGGASGADMRIGSGWHVCEDWGVWTKTKDARLVFALPQQFIGQCNLYFGIRTSIHSAVSLTIICPKLGYEGQLDLQLGTDTDFKIRLGDIPVGCETLEVVLASDALHDLAINTDGVDQRRIGIGLRWLALASHSDLPARLDLAEALRLAEPRSAS